MSDDDEGYVHRPGGGDTARTSDSDGSTGQEAAAAGGEDDAFGTKGWVLVASLVVATLIIPGVIYLYPTAPGEAGFSFFAAMLALPMIPAVLLGLTAVWSMTAATE